MTTIVLSKHKVSYEVKRSKAWKAAAVVDGKKVFIYLEASRRKERRQKERKKLPFTSYFGGNFPFRAESLSLSLTHSAYFVHVSMEMLSPRTGWKNTNGALELLFYTTTISCVVLAATWPNTEAGAMAAMSTVGNGHFIFGLISLFLFIVTFGFCRTRNIWFLS